MKTRIIHTKLWKDGFIAGLSPTEKLVFLYYLTNDKVNLIHCYECADREVCFDTGVNAEQLRNAKEKLAQAGKVLFYKDYVFLANANKYETFSGEKNDQAKVRLESEMSDDVRAWYSNPFDTPQIGVSIGVSIPPINHKSEIINHKSEIKEKKYARFSEIDEPLMKVISEDYEVPLDFVKQVHESMRLYLGSKNLWSKYSDYNLALRSWVRRDADKIKLEMAKSKSYRRGGVYDARE